MTTRVRPSYRHVVEQILRQVPDPLTPREMEIIEHRQVQVARAVRPVLVSPDFQAVAEPKSISTKGGIAYQRQLMFARTAIFNEGRNLLSHWPTIKREMRMPWSVHYYNMSLGAWKPVGGQLGEHLLLRPRLTTSIRSTCNSTRDAGSRCKRLASQASASWNWTMP